MDDINVRLDPQTLEAIERRARQSGRSVGEEISTIVQDDVAGRLRPVDPVEWSRRIRAMTPKGASQTPAVDLIREGRDR